jgi:L-fuconolactonase
VAKPHGVTATVVVEASAWLEDNQWLLDLAAKEQALVGIVGHLNPGETDFEKHVRRFAMNRLYRGIRVGHAAITKGLSERRFRRDIALLAEHDLELDVNGGPDMPADVAKLAAEVPALRIVINHVANVTIDGKEPPANWRSGMQAAAAHKNVFCKVSALAEGAQRRGNDVTVPDDVAFYLPVLDTVWNLFGEDRLIYGSNWPVCERAAPYATVFKVVNDYFRDKGADAANKYFRRNSQAAYKWVARK